MNQETAQFKTAFCTCSRFSAFGCFSYPYPLRNPRLNLFASLRRCGRIKLMPHRCSVYKMGVPKFPAPRNFGESYAQTSGEIRPRTDEGIRRRYAGFPFSGVADGYIAGAGDNCPLLAGDTI
jgi:hypothetical protein